MIEHDMIGARGVIYFELSPHWFFYTPEQPTRQDDISDGVTSFKLTHVVWSGLGLLDHFQSHRSEYFASLDILLLLLLLATSTTMIVIIVVVSVIVSIIAIIPLTVIITIRVLVVVVTATTSTQLVVFPEHLNN